MDHQPDYYRRKREPLGEAEEASWSRLQPRARFRLRCEARAGEPEHVRPSRDQRRVVRQEVRLSDTHVGRLVVVSHVDVLEVERRVGNASLFSRKGPPRRSSIVDFNSRVFRRTAVARRPLGFLHQSNQPYLLIQGFSVLSR